MSRLKRYSARGMHALRRVVIWPFTSERLTAIASLVTVLLLVIAVVQLCDLRDQRALRSLQILMYFDQQLNSGSNVKIRHAIENGRPILQANGGRFTRDELGDYLDIFEGLADSHTRGQVDRGALYFWHSYYLVRAFENQEIKRFVKEEQKQDPDFYTGFEALGQRMLDEGTASSPKLKRPALKTR